MNQKPIALIFSTVWPEPESSAAGVRQLQWSGFLSDLGFEVILSSPSKVKEELQFKERLLPLPLNRSEVKQVLEGLKPQIVMFDRFILEEQFGHFVYEACPEALVLMETQDLHFVRRARETIREHGFSQTDLPKDFYKTDTALRETASLLRVDASFVVSSFEEQLLRNEFQIAPSKVEWVPFFYDEPSIALSFRKQFSEREGFSWIGNFRHPPNVDGLRWFRAQVWPLIRKQMTDAKINVFGAYPSEEVMSWHQPEKGFFVHGPAKTLDEVFLKTRVNLAPLRFGAGVKGKILEGFRYGVPVITTPVGAEGLLPVFPGHSMDPFPGRVMTDAVSFAEACTQLYKDEALWSDYRSSAMLLMNEVYSSVNVVPQLKKRINELLAQKKSEKLPDWTSRILRHEQINSHLYFSRWIEEKEKK